MNDPAWLEIKRGEAPLLVSLPHTGVDLEPYEKRFVSAWLARKDADWLIERLYDFTAGLGATILRTTISRSVIDVNRDPSGASLYPGMATTELCPTTTFDGEPIYHGETPSADEIAERRRLYFDPYHAALRGEIDRLRAKHGRIALYDCHSIRSIIPRLFEGELPPFNLGTNGGSSGDPALIAAVRAQLATSGQSFVVDGRFKGGWITRHYGKPAEGVHALQMELACRAYIREPDKVSPDNWPPAYDLTYAAATRSVLEKVFATILQWIG